MKMFLRRFVCFIFTLLLLFSCISPINSFADTPPIGGNDYNYLTVGLFTNIPDDYPGSQYKNVSNFPFLYRADTAMYKNVTGFYLHYYNNWSLNKGDKVIVTIKVNPNSIHWQYDSGRVQILSNNGDVVNGTNFHYSDGIITISGVVNQDFEGSASFGCYLYVTNISDSSNIASWRLDDMNVTIDGTNSLLRNIIQWLESIRDKLVNGFTEVKNGIVNKLQTFITNVGEWFDDLSLQLQSFVNNVQSFITGLGDRISGFFTTIWINISDYFTTQWNNFLRLWTIDDDFWPEYRQAWNDMLADRFGGVYEASSAVIDLLRNCGQFFDYEQSDDLTIVVPNMNFGFTVAKQHYVSIAGGSYSFVELVTGDWVDSNIYYAFRDSINIAVTAILFLAAVYQLKKIFDLIVGIRSDSSGGL